MTDEKEKYMFDTFPNLFPGGNKADITKSLMRFGFPGDGWFNILKDLCEKITATNVGVTVVQVKEKFGTLRFYIDLAEGTSKEDYTKVYALISAAEVLTEVTCEECGAPGTLRQGGWWHTACDKCEEAYQARKVARGF